MRLTMAVEPDQIDALPPLPPLMLWARLPLQAALAALVMKATRPRQLRRRSEWSASPSTRYDAEADRC
jgi:uncharacterized membrane protein